jgi:hypothetical protein
LEELASDALEEAKIVAEMDAILAEAKTACGKLRFDRAKEAVAAHRSQASNVSSIDMDRVRKKLDAMLSGADENVGGMMMAARKGRKLSDSDEEGAVDDLAQLEALEKDAEPTLVDVRRALVGRTETLVCAKRHPATVRGRAHLNRVARPGR